MRKFAFRRYLRSFYFQIALLATLIIVVAIFATRNPENPTDDNRSPKTAQSTYSQIDSDRPSGPFGIGSEGWTAIFTGTLAFFQIVLSIFGIIQIYFLIRSDETNGIAADAAKASALALQASEMAHLSEFIESNNLEFIIHEISISSRFPQYEVTENLTVTYGFNNFGKTPGTIIGFSGEILHAATVPESDPVIWHQQVRSRENLERYILPPMTPTKSIQTTRAFDLTKSNISDLFRYKRFIWFIGHIAWEDVLDGQNIRMFVWQYDVGVRAFKPFRTRIVRNVAKADNESGG